MKNIFYLTVVVLVCSICLLLSSDSTATFGNAKRANNYELLVKARLGDVEGVRQLLNNGANPNTPPGPNDRGMTALMFAAWKGNSEIVNLLVRAGANVNAVSNTGATIERYGFDRSLELGANVNAVSNTGATPLIYAANAGSDESVRILLANGARTDAKMRDGTTALFYGVMSGNHIVTNLIVARSSPATINAKQTNGDNALIRAVKLGNLNVIDSILNGNPALEEKDQFGQTALMNAARKGLTRAAIHLLRKGANPNARDNNSITALTKATIGKHRATQQVLRAAGGRP